MSDEITKEIEASESLAEAFEKFFSDIERDKIKKHYEDTGKWEHGYWKMNETIMGQSILSIFFGIDGT